MSLADPPPSEEFLQQLREFTQFRVPRGEERSFRSF
jgi:hypothetical protein